MLGRVWDGKVSCDSDCDEDCPGWHTKDTSPIPSWLLPWDGLSAQMREAAMQLGYRKMRWDEEDNAACGRMRYTIEDWDTLYRIRQDEAGNWHTKMYLDFRNYRSQNADDAQFSDFLQQRYGSSLAVWRRMHGFAAKMDPLDYTFDPESSRYSFEDELDKFRLS